MLYFCFDHIEAVNIGIFRSPFVTVVVTVASVKADLAFPVFIDSEEDILVVVVETQIGTASIGRHSPGKDLVERLGDDQSERDEVV